MPALSTTASALVRSTARAQLPALRAASATALAVQNRTVTSATASFESPFKGGSASRTTDIPVAKWKKYRNSGGETGQKVFQYFMVGTMGAISAMGAKNTVQGGYFGSSRRIEVQQTKF